MFKLAGAAIGQKLRGLLNPIIGEKTWVVNKEAALEKAKAVWQAMPSEERVESDFSGGSTSIYGRILTAAQKLADRANVERAVIVDSPLVHRISKPEPLTAEQAEQADRGWPSSIWSDGGESSSLPPAYYSGSHGFESGGEFQHEPGSGGSTPVGGDGQ